MDRQEGKRVAKDAGMPTGAKVAIGAVAAAVVLLVAGYMALCFQVSGSGTFLPNSAIAGVDVGGLTQGQAAEALREKLPPRLAELSVPFLCAGTEYSLSLIHI